MIKIFIFFIAAFALPPIIKLKMTKEISVHSSAIQDFQYFSTYANYLQYQTGSSPSEFEISPDCFDVMPYLISLLTQFKHGNELQSEFTDFTRLNYCASFYAAPEDFLKALQLAQKIQEGGEKEYYTELHLEKKDNENWKTVYGPLDINEDFWSKAAKIAIQNGYQKVKFGTNFMTFRKFKLLD